MATGESPRASARTEQRWRSSRGGRRAHSPAAAVSGTVAIDSVTSRRASVSRSVGVEAGQVAHLQLAGGQQRGEGGADLEATDRLDAGAAPGHRGHRHGAGHGGSGAVTPDAPARRPPAARSRPWHGANSPVATAAPAQRWLLIEQPGPWGRDALAESRFDQPPWRR